MPEVKFKFIGDDSELRKKLANLAKMQSEISDKFDANLTKSLSSNAAKAIANITNEADQSALANKNLRDAQLANIEAIRKLREERAREMSELVALQQIEQEHKAILAEKQRETEALAQEEKQLTIDYKKRQLEIQEYNKKLKEESEERRKASADQKESDKIAKEALRQKNEDAKKVAADEKKALKQKAEELKKATAEQKEAEKVAKQSEKARKDSEREALKQAKAAEKRRKELEKENSAYYQLNKALGNVRKEARDVLSEMFQLEQAGHKASAGYAILKKRAEELTEQTNILDKGLKKIDATLGIHFRNVGNYTDAFSGISPIFDSIESKLNFLGTSLQELSENGISGFVDLAHTVYEFGKAVGKFLISPIGIAITAVAGLFMLFQANKQTVIDFNAGLLNVSKTTGLTGASLMGFSDSIILLSRSLKTVSADKLLEYSSVAGQLGVKGTQNILTFTEAMAKLETASDISGEEGASQIARLLQLVDGGVQHIKAFGDEIVQLGNNFPATESEILANATRIAQSTGVYKLGRQEILAYATATKSVGVEAELVGSTLGRTLGTLEKSIRSGKGVADILKLVGGTRSELESRFRDDASGVLMDFIGGLNRTSKTASDFNKNLEAVGITAQRDRDVIGSLASKGFAVLSDAMNQVKESSGAMDAEFSTASEKLVNQTQRIGIAWDNFILGIENGQGAIGKASVAVIGLIADTIDAMSSSSMSTDNMTASYLKFQNQTERTEQAVKPLLSRYEELKSRANLNKQEHEELRGVIQKIAQLIPSAITEFNKYGDVIDINRDKVLKFNEEQKKLVRDMNISTRKSLNDELSELKRQRDDLVSLQNNATKGKRGTSLVSRIFSIGQNEEDRVKGIESRTQRIAIITDKIKTNLQRTKDLGGVLNEEDAKFLARFTDEQPSPKTNDGKNEEVVKKNKEFWEAIVTDTQAALDRLEVSEKGSTIWNELERKLKEAQANVDKYSLSKNESASKNAEKIAEEQRKAVERQRSLQLEIDKINENASRNQLTRDLSEVESVKDKYSHIKEEIRKFANDPKNKGLKVNISGLLASEKFEVSEAETRQDTKKLTESLDLQKQLLDEYNAYAEQTSKEEADRRYANQLQAFIGYKDRLKKEYDEIITLEKNAGSGDFTGSTRKLTQAQEERAKALRAKLDALDKEDREKEGKKYLEAFNAAKTFNDKLLDIERDHQEKIKTLKDQGQLNPEREAILDKERAKKVSALASDELTGSQTWTTLFSDLDALTADQLEKLIKEVEAKFSTLKVNFNPIDLDTIRKKLKEARQILIQDNPFAQVGAAIRDIMASAGDDSKDAAEKTKVAWRNLASATKGSFDFVTDAISSASFLKDAIGDIGNTALLTLMAIASTAIAVSAAIKTAEKASVVLAIIQAALVVVNAIAGLFKSIFAAGDKRLEKSIQSKKQAVEELDRAFERLGRTIDKSIGNSYYTDSQKQIDNLKAQAVLVEQMMKDEDDKKKTDQGKMQDYRNQLEDIQNKIEDIQQSIIDNLVQTTFKDLANELGDALVSAFESGEDAVKSLNKSFDQFVKDAIINSLKMTILQKPIDEMIKSVSDYMKGNDFSLNGYDFSKWKEKLGDAGKQFTDALDSAYKGMGLQREIENGATGIKGAIQKEMTEATASVLTNLYKATYELLKNYLEEIKSQGVTHSKHLLVAIDSLRTLNAIQVNTAETVVELKNAVTELKVINKNTSGSSKGRTSEGMGL